MQNKHLIFRGLLFVNKKSIAFISITAFAIGSYAYLSEKNNSDTHIVANIGLTPEKNEAANIATKKIPIEKRESIVTPPAKPQQTQRTEPIHIDDLMFTSSQKAEDFLKASGKLRKDLAGEVYLEINAEQLLGLTKGDTFQLDIPELKILHDIEVKEAYQDQFGNKTVEAHLSDQDAIYGSVFTINERAIYANVSTPNGIYVMQGNGQYVWMAETNDLSKEAVMDPM